MKYRRKPIVVEAIQFNGVWTKDLSDFCGEKAIPMMHNVFNNNCSQVLLSTPDGRMYADIGDWIIKGDDGEIHLVHERLFAEFYEKVDDLQNKVDKRELRIDKFSDGVHNIVRVHHIPTGITTTCSKSLSYYKNEHMAIEMLEERLIFMGYFEDKSEK